MPGQRPNYGAIGATFVSVRILSIVCMLCIIGLTSNFIAEIVNANLSAPEELVGTLSVVCIGIVYSIVTLILYADNILPFLISAGVDGLVLIALIVVSVSVGKPLTYLNCSAIGSSSSSGGDATSAWDLTTALEDTLDRAAGLVFVKLVDETQTTCYEMKAVWGLAIALCILFAFSTASSLVLWRQKPKFVKSEV